MPGSTCRLRRVGQAGPAGHAAAGTPSSCLAVQRVALRLMWGPLRVSGALGWAASLDILLLFYPVPRSCFLNRLLGAGFPLLIKYHRWLGHGTMWLLTLHGWGYYALWCVSPLGARPSPEP